MKTNISLSLSPLIICYLEEPPLFQESFCTCCGSLGVFRMSRGPRRGAAAPTPLKYQQLPAAASHRLQHLSFVRCLPLRQNPKKLLLHSKQLQV